MKSAEGLGKYGLIALAIPFVAMVLMIGMNVRNISGADEYRFAIEGYDPRDILRGHYLTFRYRWPGTPADSCSSRGSEACCACLSGVPDRPSVSFSSCDTLEQGGVCKGVIPVEKWSDDVRNIQPDELLRRYYIPAAQATQLDRLLRGGKGNFEVGLVPLSGGGAQLKELYIDGKPLPEYLRDMPPSPDSPLQTRP